MPLPFSLHYSSLFKYKHSVLCLVVDSAVYLEEEEEEEEMDLEASLAVVGVGVVQVVLLEEEVVIRRQEEEEEAAAARRTPSWTHGALARCRELPRSALAAPTSRSCALSLVAGNRTSSMLLALIRTPEQGPRM